MKRKEEKNSLGSSHIPLGPMCRCEMRYVNPYGKNKIDFWWMYSLIGGMPVFFTTKLN